ncbi:MAG: DNA topoisomerase, partial [Candidatus Thermoplasmatota archaeon]
LSGNRRKVYELILRRFLATLAPYGIKRLRKAEFDIKNEKFKSSGTELVKDGWRKYYPYYKFKETEIPSLTESEKVDVSDVDIEEKETQPPNRYSQGKLVQLMEDNGLGTKSTRHGIIQKLYNRNFIKGKVPRSTVSGKSVIKTLEKHAEMVAKPDMTRTLEEDMQKIAEADIDREKVIEESREMLQKVVKSLKEDKEEISKELKRSLRDQNAVGECPRCEDGTLVIRKSSNGRFVGCSNYPDCKNTYPLPQKGGLESAGKQCEECGAPIQKMARKTKEDWEFCPNPDCSSEDEEEKE